MARLPVQVVRERDAVRRRAWLRDWMQQRSQQRAEPAVEREHLPRVDPVVDLVDVVRLARLLRRLLRSDPRGAVTFWSPGTPSRERNAGEDCPPALTRAARFRLPGIWCSRA